MSSIVDFASLSTAVANWMVRAGNADFVSNVGDFIGLFESNLNYGSDDPEYKIPPMRCSQMEVASTTFTILNSTNSIALPSDYLQLRRNYLTGSPNVKLSYVTPNQMDATLPNSPNVPPGFFTIMGNSIVLPAPVNTTQSLVGGYYQKVPALSSSNTVNWLVQADPWMYLAGASMMASLFLGDDDSTAKWARIVSAKVRAFNNQDLKGRYNGDVLQMRTDTGNP